ncbi:MAG: carbohydrate binding domain-containing protein [Chitinispirillaceae bacterium]|nr:carbohydrate binding domain-containing protein [Chitinispirillaceae bacterium]
MKIFIGKEWRRWLLVLLPFLSVQAQENLIVNGNFTDTSGWNLGIYNNGEATGTVDDNSYVIAISSPGTEVWSIQFTQSGIALDTGVAYTLSFSIAATVERTVEVSLSQDGGEYKPYSGRDTLHLSSEVYHYEKLFVMSHPTDTNVRLEFNCGKTEGSITISDVKLVRFTGTILRIEKPSAGDLLYSGIPYTVTWSHINVEGSLAVELSGDNGSSWTTVDSVDADARQYLWIPEATHSPWCLLRLTGKGTGDTVTADTTGIFELAPLIDLVRNGLFANEQYWNFGVYGGAAQGGVSEDGGYHIAIDTAASELWQIQLTQSGINIVNGKRYRLTFIAYALEATDIQVNIGMDHEPFSTYFDTTEWMISLSDEPALFTYDFVMEAESDSAARLEFNCGNATKDVFIDEVRLVEWYVASADMPVRRTDRSKTAVPGVRVFPGNGWNAGWWLPSQGTGNSGYRIIDLKGRCTGMKINRNSSRNGRAGNNAIVPGAYLIHRSEKRRP